MTDHPGPVAQALPRLRDRRGIDAASWADATSAAAGDVVELHITDSGALLRRHGTPVRVRPDSLPLRTNAVLGASVVGLHLLERVDGVFAELRRVLAPGGTLVVVVPSVSIRSAAELRAARLLRPVRRGAWPQRAALDGMGWLLTTADFSVIGDDRVAFTLTLAPDAGASTQLLVAAGLWPTGLPDGFDAQLGRYGPGVPVPLRRLVARR